MNAVWQHFWQQRSPQEQRTLSLAALALALMIGYQFVWTPIHHAAQTADARLAEAQALAAFTAQARQTLTASRPRASVDTAAVTGAPLVWLGQQAKAAGIDTTLSTQQMTADGIQLAFDGVPFNALIRWLNQAQAAGFTVLRAEIRPIDAGLVQATLTLSAPVRS